MDTQFGVLIVIMSSSVLLLFSIVSVIARFDVHVDIPVCC